MTYEQVMERLHGMADPASLEGQARYGIDISSSLGIRMPQLRALARETGGDHDLAARLWASGVREARLLAAMVDVPALVTEAQMESWVLDIKSWEVCDAACSDLFRKTPFAYAKVYEWSARDEEFVKRAAFSLIAQLAVHDKKAPDSRLIDLLPLIEREAADGRNYVRKAVNWALRSIGKRNLALNAAAAESARRIAEQPSSSAHWVASDALRELTGDAVQTSLNRRTG